MYIYNEKRINIVWHVYKGISNVHEDFRKGKPLVFLSSPTDRYPLAVTCSGGVITASVPPLANLGNYSIDAVWTKEHGKTARCKYENIFTVTDIEDKDSTGEEAPTVELRSYAVVYGFDGLSAYEIAVIHGYKGTEAEWIDQVQGNANTLGDIQTRLNALEEFIADMGLIFIYPPVISVNNYAVSIRCATAGTTIYYTLDGSDPSEENGTEYSGAFTPAADCTIKAIAVDADKNYSKIATFQYTAAVTYPTFWIGLKDGTRAAFASLSTTALVDAATAYNDTLTVNTTVESWIYYIMIPDTLSFESLVYTSSGLISRVEDLSKFNTQHDDVTINGTTYHVYGYRAEPSDPGIVYTLTLNEA